MRRTRLERRTPLRRTGRLRRQSPKQAEIVRKRRALAAEMGPEATCAYPGCSEPPVTLHEVLRRSQGGDPTDPAVAVPICGPHHSFCHDNPEQAYKLGMLKRRWSNSTPTPEPERKLT